MPALGEDVHLRHHACTAQGRGHHQRVLHRNGAVLKSVPEEGRRGLVGNLGLQRVFRMDGKILATRQIDEAPPMRKLTAGDDRVAQHHGVRLGLFGGQTSSRHEGCVMPVNAQAARSMSAG